VAKHGIVDHHGLKSEFPQLPNLPGTPWRRRQRWHVRSWAESRFERPAGQQADL